MDYRRTNFTASTGSFAIDYSFGLRGAWNTALDGVSVIGGVTNDLSFLHDLTINSKRVGAYLTTAGKVVPLGEAAFRASEGDYSGSLISLVANYGGMYAGKAAARGGESLAVALS